MPARPHAGIGRQFLWRQAGIEDGIVQFSVSGTSSASTEKLAIVACHWGHLSAMISDFLTAVSGKIAAAIDFVFGCSSAGHAMPPPIRWHGHIDAHFSLAAESSGFHNATLDARRLSRRDEAEGRP